MQPRDPQTITLRFNYRLWPPRMDVSRYVEKVYVVDMKALDPVWSDVKPELSSGMADEYNNQLLQHRYTFGIANPSAASIIKNIGYQI